MGRGRGGSGRGGGSVMVRSSGRVRGRHSVIGQHVTSRKEKSNSGLSKSLGNSMFTYGEKNYADKIRTTWEKVIQHIVISIGQDISKESQMRKIMVIPDPNHSQEILYRHMCKVQLHNTTHARLREARNNF